MKRVTLLLALGLLLAAAGCKKSNPAPTQSNPTGTNSSNVTAPSENQQALQELLDAQVPSSVEGVTGGGNLMFPPIPNPNLDVYVVHTIWGTLGPSSTPGTPTDWSGQAFKGPLMALKVAALISFDKGQDTLLTPPDSSTASWISFTKSGDIDGLSFMLTVDPNSPLTVIPTFTFTTKPVSFTLPVDRLRKLDTIIFVDNQNALVIVARKLPRPSCPAGAIAGLWIKATNAGDTGTFEGKWMAPSNTQSGYMMGNFWTTNTGSRQFSGVYTDINKTTVGYLKGFWRYDDPSMCILCGSGHGMFAGIFTNLDTVAVGQIYAEIGDMTNLSPQLQLPYKGFWKAYCHKPETEATEQ